MDAPLGIALIRVLAGTHVGSTYELKKPIITIGRAIENDIIITDLSISRIHSEIVWENGKWIIRSVTHGHVLTVNDQIDIQEAVLHDQDVVSLGRSFKFLFLIDAPKQTVQQQQEKEPSFTHKGRVKEPKIMLTKWNKSFSFGFILTEQELRRIYDVLRERMGRITSYFSTTFEVRFKNEIIAERASLDAVLLEENAGRASVQALTITLVEAKQTQSPTKIKLSFVAGDKKPITYHIEGNDRDWVYHTGSTISESIKRIKNKYRLSTSKDNLQNSIFTCVLPLFFTVTYIVIFFLQPNFHPGSLIFLSFCVVILISCGIFLSLCLIPLYNFNWGEYNKVFDRRKARAKFVIFGILTTLILGVISGIIANLLTRS